MEGIFVSWEEKLKESTGSAMPKLEELLKDAEKKFGLANCPPRKPSATVGLGTTRMGSALQGRPCFSCWVFEQVSVEAPCPRGDLSS